MTKEEQTIQDNLMFRIGNEIIPRAHLDKQKEFYIRTNSCEIPYIYPYEEEVMRILLDQTIPYCVDEESRKIPREIVQLQYDVEVEQYKLHFLYPMLDKMNATNSKSSTIAAVIDCCYVEIKRGSSDSQFA